jgi:basic membrane protein A and related proteins
MLLVQAGASGTRPRHDPSPTAGPVCARTFHVGFVADVAGLGSSVDAAGWRGVGKALHEMSSCGRADLALPTRPSDYRRTLQAYAGYDLVVAGSFLLTDPVVDIARANPATHFVLVDPIVTPPNLRNLAVLTFRADETAFLAGALAGMVTRTGVVAGVYGPEGAIDRSNRAGFEHGARYVRPTVRVLGAYQPAQDGEPYANPAWGSSQARAFSSQQADVIFGAGGTTGQGALLGAAQSGRVCINAQVEAVPDAASDQGAGCLLASAVTHVERGVAITIADAASGRWQAGPRRLGLADSAVGLSVYRGVMPQVQERLKNISDLLVSGALTTGA